MHNAKQSRITIPAQDAAIAGPVVPINDKGHPRSPTLLGAGDPLSPAVSNASLRFKNATALRNNQPTSQSIRIEGAEDHEPPQEGAEKGGNHNSSAGQQSKSPLVDDVADPTPRALRQANKFVDNEAEHLGASKEMGPGVVCEFLRFQIWVNIVAVIITTFVTAVASSTESLVPTTFQLLWVNIIIVDTFAALALDAAPAPAAGAVHNGKAAPSFNTAMRMQIIGQSMYQTLIILLLHFAGDIIFGYDGSTHTELQIQQRHSELDFNAFLFYHIFNSINWISSRRIDSKKTVFTGIHKNFYFIIITLIEVAAQIVIVFVGGGAFSLHHLSSKSWGISLAVGFGSFSFGFLIRLIPEEPIERILRKPSPHETPISTRSENQDKERNSSAFQTTKDDLSASFDVGN